MVETTEAAPTACMLDGGNFKARMHWIAVLNARALVAARRDDLRLELDYTSEAIGDVRQMIEQEEECCGFLAFDLVEHSDIVRLAIVAPEAARDSAEFLFRSFQATFPQKAACGCAGGCGA